VDYRIGLGLALIAVVVWVVMNMDVRTTKQATSKHLTTASEVQNHLLGPLAKRKKGLVKCSVATPTVPLYKRSETLHQEAQRLAVSVARGKVIVVKHMDKGSVRVCSPSCDVRTVIAGIVRDRSMLKKLEYDQHF